MPKAVHFDVPADDPERVNSFTPNFSDVSLKDPWKRWSTLRILKTLKENLDQEETGKKAIRRPENYELYRCQLSG